jgi:hypothetical protein
MLYLEGRKIQNSKLTESQNIGFYDSRKQEKWLANLCREHGISLHTFYRRKYRKKYFCLTKLNINQIKFKQEKREP